MRNGTRREALDAERIRLLYHNARFAIIGIFLATFLFALFFWDDIAPQVWSVWLTAIIIINIPRLLLVEFFHYQRGQIQPEEYRLWERRFYFGVVFSSLSWASISFFPFEGDIIESIAFTALLLVGMSAASIVSLITSRNMGLTFLSAVMLPLIGRILWEGEEGTAVIAITCATYYGIFAQMSLRMHKTIVDNLSLKLENEELSLKDALTGLWNRRELYLFVDQLSSQAQRNKEDFSLILMDLDHFKDYNDSNGHNAGDALLVQVARIIEKESRQEDLVVRYGGEEFIVVLPRADMAKAQSVAERIREEVKRKTAISLSAGVAVYRSGMSFESITHAADEALYRAKSEGRDRVICDNEPATELA